MAVAAPVTARRCAWCGRLIPRTDGPAHYARRKFCRQACAALAQAHRHDPALNPPALPDRPGAVKDFPEEIVACVKCGSTRLRTLEVGKSCFDCGKILYARVGDWRGEAQRYGHPPAG